MSCRSNVHRSPEQIIKMIGFDSHNYMYDVFMLVGQAFAMKVLAFIVLRSNMGGGL